MAEDDRRRRAAESAQAFADLVADAPVEDVGADPEYRPDSPRLREQMDEAADE